MDDLIDVNEFGSYVYKVICTVNGRMYINADVARGGNLVELEKLLSAGEHPNKKLQYDYTKYGHDKFEVRVISKISDNEFALKSLEYVNVAIAEIIKSHGKGALYNTKFVLY